MLTAHIKIISEMPEVNFLSKILPIPVIKQ